VDVSSRLAKRILEAAPDPTVLVDGAGVIVYANIQVEAVLGHRPSDLVGSPVEVLLPERLRAAHPDRRARYLADPTPRPMGSGLDLFALHKDGHEIPVEISLSPVVDEDETLVISAIRDVSEHKALTRQLAEANRAKSRFLAAASHDLRQPIQALNLLNSAARKASTEQARDAIIEKQQLCAVTMGRLLNSLLDISKLEAGIVKPDIADHAVQEIFNELRAEFEEQARAKGIELVVETCSAVVRSDRQLLMQILENLLSNAIRYTHEGLVKLCCRRQNPFVRIDVLDTGIGIRSEDIEFVFDEFHQVDFDARRPEGLGLGLSIVKRAADLLACPLEVESKIGDGSRFSIAVRSGEAAHVLPRNVQSSDCDPRGGRILIVDDEPAVADATQVFLQAEGFDVDVAACVEEAEAAMRRASAGLVITDYHLRRGQTGFDVVRALRRMPGSDMLPVILVSGDTSGRVELQDYPDVCLVTKPVDPEKLLAEIRSRIRTA